MEPAPCYPGTHSDALVGQTVKSILACLEAMNEQVDFRWAAYPIGKDSRHREVP